MRGYGFVVIAAVLWGTLGLLFRTLHDGFGLSGIAIAFLRATVSGVILASVLAITRRDLLKISRAAIPFFIAYGFVGVAAFYFTYVNAVIQTTVTTAVVLLYTAPVFVTLIAWRVWHEKFDARKLIALVLAFVGCGLVARAYDPGELSLNGIGLALGLGAGITYALYTIFSKFALARFSSWTALTFALLIGAIFLAPIQNWNEFAPLAQQPLVWLPILALAIGPTLGSLAFYNAGLQRVPASNASLVANIEPVVASVIAFVILGERMELLQMIGGGMVLVGAMISNQ